MPKIVAAMVQVILLQGFEQKQPETSAVEMTAVHVLKKIEAMPFWLKIPIVILTHVFNSWTFVTTGRGFAALNFVQRAQILRVWQQSPLKLCRDFVQFYEKLSFFIYFSSL